MATENDILQGTALFSVVSNLLRRSSEQNRDIWDKLHRIVGGGDDRAKIRLGHIKVDKWLENKLAMTPEDIAQIDSHFHLRDDEKSQLISAAGRLRDRLAESPNTTIMSAGSGGQHQRMNER